VEIAQKNPKKYKVGANCKNERALPAERACITLVGRYRLTILHQRSWVVRRSD
jgi:hypothetical protein